MIEWALGPGMQRRAQLDLNKGESHHALKNALRIGRQGESRDRTTEGRHYRTAGLNLLAAIVIYWNTVRLGEAVARRRRAGLPVPSELLRTHLASRLGAHPPDRGIQVAKAILTSRSECHFALFRK